MNKQVLLQARADILAHPDQCQMSSFFSDYLDMPDGHGGSMPAGGCGTAACIAGWIIFRKRQFDSLKQGHQHVRSNSHYSPEDDAGAYAGLNSFERSRLFFTCEWPSDCKTEYYQATTPAATAQAMANRIDRFIESEGTV